jgi:hypothetical protein
MSNYIVEIDPLKKSIEKVSFADNTLDLDDLYSSLDCTMVERVSLNSELDLWVDEEGGINGASERIGYFNIGEYQFIGKGLICSVSADGETIPLNEELADAIVETIDLEF